MDANEICRETPMAAPRKDNVKEKILDATEALLKSKSLSDITLSEIAASAGVSKGTLYYHYKNKTDILFDLTDRYLAQQWDELISWTENREKDTSINRLVKYVLERNVESAGIRLHLLNAAMLGDEPLREKLIARYGEFEKLIAEKIAERTSAVEADYLTRLILLASDGLIVQEAIKNEDFRPEDFIARSADYIKKLNNK